MHGNDPVEDAREALIRVAKEEGTPVITVIH
nr:hypothetical protein [Rhizobium bangladeshense]